MKKLLLITLLCFCVNAYAFNWAKVTESEDRNSYYVDIDNIRKHNNLVYYWTLVDYKKPFNNKHFSEIAKYKVDCGEQKKTLLSITAYSQPMGENRISDETIFNDIAYPKPGSVGYGLMMFACDNAK
jgi:hypothetical protein